MKTALTSNTHLLLALAAFLSGCASTHDLSKGPGAFGGGVMHRQIQPGLFFVQSQTNWAPVPMPGSAASGWADEADKACTGKAWKEINTTVSTRDTGMVGILPYLISEKVGYALCDGSNLSEEEVSKLAK